MSDIRITRRGLLAGGGALSAMAVLTACGGGGRPRVAPTQIDGVQLTLPSNVALEKFPGAHISSVEGIAPAYEAWPANARAAVASAPGRGGPLKTLAPTWSTTPPAVAQNPWAQQLEKDLNVKWDANVAADYSQVAPSVLASGSLPDLMYLEFTSNPAVLQALEQGAFADLTPYLAGDKIKEFPNLAKLPSYAWRVSSRYKKLWIVPNTLSRIHQADVWRKDWVKAVGHDGSDPKSVDEFTQILTAIKGKKPGRSGGYPITTLDRGLQLAREMFRAPTNWKEEQGKFTHMVETEEFVQGLKWAAEAWKAGLFHPDALTLTWSKEREMVEAGNAFMTLNVLTGLWGSGTSGVRGKLAKVDPNAELVPMLVPGATSAGPNLVGTSPGFWGGGAISAAHAKDEKKMKELLGILDFWVSPFGTKEFLMMNFGLEGRQVEITPAGQLRPTTDQAKLDELNLNVMAATPYLYFPDAPEVGVGVQKIMEQRAQHYLPDPTWTLSSRVWMQKTAPLKNLIDDATRAIVTGAAPVSSWSETVQRWRSAGGDEARRDIEKQFQDSRS